MRQTADRADLAGHHERGRDRTGRIGDRGAAFRGGRVSLRVSASFRQQGDTLKKLRKGESNKSDLGGVLQTNNIHIAIAPAGEVTRQLGELQASPATARFKAKFIVATDGETFEAENLISGDTVACAFQDFPDTSAFSSPWPASRRSSRLPKMHSTSGPPAD